MSMVVMDTMWNMSEMRMYALGIIPTPRRSMSR